MNRHQHGGLRPGAGRKPQPRRRGNRAITRSVRADAVVLAHPHPGEPSSQAVERLLCQHAAPTSRPSAGHPPLLAALLAPLTPEYQAVAVR